MPASGDNSLAARAALRPSSAEPRQRLQGALACQHPATAQKITATESPEFSLKGRAALGAPRAQFYGALLRDHRESVSVAQQHELHARGALPSRATRFPPAYRVPLRPDRQYRSLPPPAALRCAEARPPPSLGRQLRSPRRRFATRSAAPR